MGLISKSRRRFVVNFLVILQLFLIILAGDQPQWGERHSRNMVSKEVALPDNFDPKTGKNVRWETLLGTEVYSTPVIGQGKVLIGTNNGQPRDSRHSGDRGVLMCFNQADGSFAWQLTVPKLSEDRYLDWPHAGICSPATVDGNRVYIVTNRNEVACLDLNGMADGNDGPFLDESRHMTPRDLPPIEVGRFDADILWLLDLRSAVGVRPHDSAHSSILVDGPFLYLNTSNGLNSRHDGVEKPSAPSLVVLDKETGQLVAQDGENIGPRIFHCTWSSPALGEVNGRRLVFFGGGDGVVYAFEALNPAQQTRLTPSEKIESPKQKVEILRCVWRFDCDPLAPKKDVHRFIGNRRESPSTIMGMPVFHDGRIYLTVGGDLWWGKREAWLKCIDATRTGDITDSGLIWSYPLERHSFSTPSVHNGLVYVSDCGGKVHCVDARTGKAHWIHNARREMWSSTLVADGKVYAGTRRGEFWILAAGKELQVLNNIQLVEPIISTPVAAGGVLYIATMSQLFALQE